LITDTRHDQGRRVKSTQNNDFEDDLNKSKETKKKISNKLAATYLPRKCDEITDRFHKKMKELDELQILMLAEVQCEESIHAKRRELERLVIKHKRPVKWKVLSR